MSKRISITHLAALMLVALLVLVSLGCGGKRSSTPSVAGPALGQSSADSGMKATDSTYRGIPITELYKYGPRIQMIMASPLWDAPLPAVTAPDVKAAEPTTVTVNDALSYKTVVDPRDPAMKDKYQKGVSFVAVKGQTASNVIATYRVTDVPGTPGGGLPPTDLSIFQPKYNFATTATPPFGNDAPPTGTHNGREDIIGAVSALGATASGYVFRGLPTTNPWLSQNNVFACGQTWQIAAADNEVSYVEIPTSPIPGVAAYKVTGTNYLRFNSFVNLNPVGFPNWHYYDFYIAPTAAESGSAVSGSGLNTVGTIQYFYQDLSVMAFGKNAIAHLISSDSPQIGQLTLPSAGVASAVPIFGGLYARWADETDTALQQPWEGSFGYPVQPPIMLNNGELRANAKGAFRAYGQYFEKGFIYWFHYVTANTPDDTLAYSYTGTNVFAQDGKYVQTDNGTVSYGSGGPLGVTCIASNKLRGKDTKGDVMASIGDFITFRAFAYGGGGPTQYSDMIWNYRDGTVDWNSVPASNYNAKRVTGHVYIDQGVYKPRGMVIQNNAANFFTGVNVAMGDTAIVRCGVVSSQLPPTKIAIIKAFSTGAAATTDADIAPLVTDLQAEGWGASDITVMQTPPASAATLAPYRGVMWVFCGQNIVNNSWPAVPTAQQNVMRAYVNDAGNRHNLFVMGSTILGTINNPGWWTGSGYLYWDTDFFENYMGLVARSGVMVGYWPTASYITGGLTNSWPPYVANQTYCNTGTNNGRELTWSKPTYKWVGSDFWMFRGPGTYSWESGAMRFASGNAVVTFQTDWASVVVYAPLTRSNLLHKLCAAADSGLVPIGTSGTILLNDDPRNDLTFPGDVKIVNVYAYTSDADGTWAGGASLNPLVPGLATSVPVPPNNQRTVHYQMQVRLRPDDVLSGRFLFYRYGYTFGDAGSTAVETNQQNPLHTYTGAVNGTNPPNNPGDPYFVACYAKRPTGADPTTAPYDTFQWMNNDGVTQAGVWVKISGFQPLLIVNDGTVISNPYNPDPATEVALITFKYKITGGLPPYDSLSWRIDSPTATPTIVTLNPAAQGQQPVPVPPGSHVVYATVIDSDAPIPPTSATVQYPTVIVNKLKVLVVQDDWTNSYGSFSAAAFANAFQTALNTIYSMSKTPTSSASLTQAKLNAYQVVIWAAPGDRGQGFSPRLTPYSGPETTANTDQYMMKAYMDQGGYMMVHAGHQPYWRWDPTNLNNRCGFTATFGASYWPKSSGDLWWYGGSYGNPVIQGSYPTYNGQGGTISTVYLNAAYPYEYTMVANNDWNGGSATVPVATDAWNANGYFPGLMRSNVGTSQQGKTLWIAWNFNRITGVTGDMNPATAQVKWMQNCLNALGVTAP